MGWQCGGSGHSSGRSVAVEVNKTWRCPVGWQSGGGGCGSGLKNLVVGVAVDLLSSLVINVTVDEMRNF